MTHTSEKQAEKKAYVEPRLERREPLSVVTEGGPSTLTTGQQSAPF